MKAPKFLIFALIAIFIIALIFIFPSKTSNTVKIETTKGNITIELNENKAPITVENFKQYVEEGFYDGTIFHRVIPGFMVQGGGFISDGTQKQTRNPIELESKNGLSNEVGTIAMARTQIPDSATSQFFINVADNNFLDYKLGNAGYAVFGKVTEGMDVVKESESATTITKNEMENWPVEEIKIIRITLI